MVRNVDNLNLEELGDIVNEIASLLVLARPNPIRHSPSMRVFPAEVDKNAIVGIARLANEIHAYLRNGTTQALAKIMILPKNLQTQKENLDTLAREYSKDPNKTKTRKRYIFAFNNFKKNLQRLKTIEIKIGDKTFEIDNEKKPDLLAKDNKPGQIDKYKRLRQITIAEILFFLGASARSQISEDLSPKEILSQLSSIGINTEIVILIENIFNYLSEKTGISNDTLKRTIITENRAAIKEALEDPQVIAEIVLYRVTNILSLELLNALVYPEPQADSAIEIDSLTQLTVLTNYYANSIFIIYFYNLLNEDISFNQAENFEKLRLALNQNPEFLEKFQEFVEYQKTQFPNVADAILRLELHPTLLTEHRSSSVEVRPLPPGYPDLFDLSQSLKP